MVVGQSYSILPQSQHYPVQAVHWLESTKVAIGQNSGNPEPEQIVPGGQGMQYLSPSGE